MKTILFSPVGSTDPISGQHDGALLHITRTYRPDLIYLYMSKEMCELEDRDSRYTYCLDKLKELCGMDFEVRVIRRPELVDVHIFDTFLDEFQQIITGILSGNEECELLLNVSSGTPAMKSALQVIAAMSEKNKIPVQVASPKKAYNDSREDVKGEYLVDLQWELNEDNAEDYENRCTVSSSINMAARMKKEIIKKHINAYDYVAALAIAEDMEGFISEDAIRLMKAGVSRLRLDRNTCDKLMAKDSYDIFPFKGREECRIVEYIILQYLKLKKDEYIDFVRGMSPLIFIAVIRIIEKTCGYDLDNITYLDPEMQKKGIFTRRWKPAAETDSDILKAGIEARRNGFVSNDQFVKLLNSISSDKEVLALVEELREIEKLLRNPVAHNIASVSPTVIKEFTANKSRKNGYSANDIMNMLVKLVRKAGINIKKEDFSSYDKMNREIEARLMI